VRHDRSEEARPEPAPPSLGRRRHAAEPPRARRGVPGRRLPHHGRHAQELSGRRLRAEVGGVGRIVAREDERVLGMVGAQHAAAKRPGLGGADRDDLDPGETESSRCHVDANSSAAGAWKHAWHRLPARKMQWYTRRIDAPTRNPAFVGRERELRLLSTALGALADGRGAVFLVTGEPGIGKTRLAHELAARAEAAGMLVAWGRCWEAGGAPAFWPWIQVLRACVRSMNEAERQAVAPLLAELVPGLGSGSARPLTLASEHARFALFDAVATLLADMGKARPVVVLFEDLHAADPASLLLLRFVAGTLRENRVMIIGTHREAEIRADPERARLLADVSREGTELPLRGLDASEAASLVEAVGGARPSAPLASSLHEVTSGNPFFLDELTRLMVAEDPGGWTGRKPPFALPDRVRVAVRRRLDALPRETLAILEAASVVGLEFDSRVIGHVLGMPAEEAVARLERAAAIGLVGEIAGRSERRRFRHALVREVLYEDLSAASRSALHRAVGEAVETLLAGRLDAALPALAYHYQMAGATERALAYVEQAGRRALAQLAYEDAVAHFVRGLELLEQTGSTDDRRRVELLQALGDARRRAGDVEAGRRTLHAAAFVARGLGDAHLLASVVLTFGWSFELGKPERERVALLEETARALGEEDSALRARVLGTLAVALYWDASARDRMLRFGQEAVDLARRVGDASSLAHALHCRRWVLGVEPSPEESLAATSQVLALAEEAGDRELVLQCRRWRVADLIGLGEIDSAWQEIDAHDDLARQLRLPLYEWYSVAWKAMRALLEGRFDDAEQDAARAYHLGARAEPSNAEAAYMGHMYYLRLHQGRTEDMLPALRVLAREGTPAPGFRSGLIGLLAEAGVETESRLLFDEFATAGFPLPRDKSVPYALASLADACALLEDAERAATLYRRLQPYGGGVIAIEPCFLVGGAADRSLAVLAATMRRWEDAERHFEAALRLNARLCARPWLARTEQEYAAMLIARDHPGDGARARELAEAALASAGVLGMTSIAMRSERVLARLGDRDVPPARDGAASECASLRKEGDYWTIDYQQREIRLRATNGIQYLARLLRTPGTELHALDLAIGDGSSAGKVGARGDAGPVLDPQARAAYRERLADLDAELEEAEATNDLGRQDRLRSERDALARELSAAVGLGGRGRRAGSATERARVNVTRAIRTALTRIGDAHPELGRHLARTVRTGTYCSYQPDPRAPIDWTE